MLNIQQHFSLKVFTEQIIKIANTLFNPHPPGLTGMALLFSGSKSSGYLVFIKCTKICLFGVFFN